MIFRSRWFPLGLAILQGLFYVALIAFNSWKGSRDFVELSSYFRRDLARPFFEPPECCHGEPTSPELARVADVCEITAFRSHDGPAIAIHFPAYAVAAALHAAISHSDVCFEALTRPRGQMFVVLMIPLLWFFVGGTVRRIAQHRWRPPAANRLSRAAFSIGFIPLPLGVFGALWLVVVVFVNPWDALRAAGVAFWCLYIPLLAAERCRIWPFSRETG